MAREKKIYLPLHEQNELSALYRRVMQQQKDQNPVPSSVPTRAYRSPIDRGPYAWQVPDDVTLRLDRALQEIRSEQMRRGGGDAHAHAREQTGAQERAVSPPESSSVSLSLSPSPKIDITSADEKAPVPPQKRRLDDIHLSDFVFDDDDDEDNYDGTLSLSELSRVR